MNRLLFLLSMVVLLCTTNKAMAHDFEVVNADGDTIWYNIIGENEVEVTYKGDEYYSFDEYSGYINIPVTVEYNGSTFFVKSINESAMRDCFNLVLVSVPSSVTNIGLRAFMGCVELIEIVVSDDNQCYSSIDGVLFNYVQDTIICYPGGKYGAYDIPNSVVTIGNYAFMYCSDLTSITIPNSVVTIEREAFYNCI